MLISWRIYLSFKKKIQIGTTVQEEIGDNGQTYIHRYRQTDIIGALYTPTHKTRELIEIYTFPVRFAHRGLSAIQIIRDTLGGGGSTKCHMNLFKGF